MRKVNGNVVCRESHEYMSHTRVEVVISSKKRKHPKVTKSKIITSKPIL